jgi:hypothetical protein
VHLDDVARAGLEVQPVDVLRDDAGDDARELEVGEGAVARVGPGRGEVPPAEVAAGPVALSRARIGEEGLERHRRAHGGALPAVVGDARVGAHARAGEHGDAATGEQVGDAIEIGGEGRVDGREGADRHPHLLPPEVVLPEG